VPALPDHVMIPPVQPVAVSVTLSVPHTSPDPDITGASGAGRLVTVTEVDDGLSPHSFLHFALYVPAPTLIVSVVKAVPLHTMLDPTGHPLAVMLTVSVPHTVPPPVKLGAPGVVALRMLITFDEADSPHEVEHTAE
jgi:hypothetical protein